MKQSMSSSFRIQTIRNLLSQEEHNEIKTYLTSKYKHLHLLKTLGYTLKDVNGIWDDFFQRYGVHNDPFLQNVHEKIAPVFAKLIGIEVKRRGSSAEFVVAKWWFGQASESVVESHLSVGDGT